ncbi:MAG: IclR family transcriptional regulator [Lachnospiraceae bacterium]|nr:IclR family transcriptional regulator [Lachnospiraceae bacterium]
MEKDKNKDSITAEESGKDKKDPYLLSTVSNTLGVLDLLSHYQGLTLAEIHRKTGQDKASLFRILYTLEKGGYVEKIEGAKYRLGYKFFFYGNRAALNSDIVQVARPFLQGLAFETKLAAHLGALHNGRIVTIHKEESPYDVQVTARVGSNAPAYATAQGQAILAFLPEERREHIIRDYTYRQYSTKSILNADECRKVLDEVRRLGYGTDIDDRFPGFGSYAVPIFDYSGEPVASVGVVATSERLREHKEEVVPKIFETARAISEKMGALEEMYPAAF